MNTKKNENDNKTLSLIPKKRGMAISIDDMIHNLELGDLVNQITKHLPFSTVDEIRCYYAEDVLGKLSEINTRRDIEENNKAKINKAIQILKNAGIVKRTMFLDERYPISENPDSEKENADVLAVSEQKTQREEIQTKTKQKTKTAQLLEERNAKISVLRSQAKESHAAILELLAKFQEAVDQNDANDYNSEIAKHIEQLEALAAQLDKDSSPWGPEVRSKSLKTEIREYKRQLGKLNQRANAILQSESKEEEDEYFKSKEAELIFYLVELDGELRMKKLGITRQHTRNLATAKKWRNDIAQLIHPDVSNHPKAAQAFSVLTEMYEQMTRR